MPNADASVATRLPIAPSPTMPSVLPLELNEQPAWPFAGADAGVHRWNSARHGEHQRDGVLGDGIRVDSGSIGHRDAARAGRREIDIVRTGTPDRDKAKPLAFADDRRTELRVATDVEHDVGVTDATNQLRFLIGAALGANRHIAEGAQRSLGGGAGDRGGKIVGDDDTRHDAQVRRATTAARMRATTASGSSTSSTSRV
jgi:hypothetical protein